MDGAPAAAGAATTDTAAAGVSPPAADLQPPSTVEAAFPGSFCAQLWHSTKDVYSSILAHPFLRGLVDGSLPEAAFRFYIAQDVLYLRQYGRSLALVASKAPRPEWAAFLCRCGLEALEVELGFHEEFLQHWGTDTAQETAGAAACPNSLLYTSWVTATVHERAFYEGLAAVLPCFVVYLEVGKALKQLGSPHPAYKAWIDKYGGPEFESAVLQTVRMVNEVAAELGDAQRERMRALFRQGCRLEYMFWDGAWLQQQWPV
ncbi:thiaminase II [Chlorella sorokiniana]|uniref:Thiaminase II n=1 Tax=Chlorella sorokiniana TaxID=3076 RepID=A0A2P6TBM5_CHLSO|nr:thiaminase II [Chlorella sorokiniana]|eukprot:PRW05947.1 thiaminase II [Chlorella sorokiniana]